MREDDLLQLHGRPRCPFVLPEEKERQRLDVPSPPPPMQCGVTSLGDRRSQAACLEERLRYAISNDELLVMSGITYKRPPVSGCSSEEVPFLDGAPDPSVWWRARDQRTGCGIGGQIGEQGGVRVGTPRPGLLDRRQTADQQLIVISLKDHADVTIGIREVHSESIGRIGSPGSRSVPISPEHCSWGVVRKVFFRLDLPGDRGMTAVRSHNEARPEHVLLTCRPGGSHAHHAISVSHKRGHAHSVKDLDASCRCRILQETVKALPARTVFSSAAGKLIVDNGVVFSQPDDMHWRRHRADCVADPHLVEDV